MLSALESPVAPNASDTQCLFAEAVRQHQAGHLPEAERLYRQVLAETPNHADAAHLLGVLASQVGRHDAAVGLIRAAIGLNGSNPAYHSNLGHALLTLRRFGEAVASFLTAVRLQPNAPEARLSLGDALRGTGRLDEAMKAYREALLLDPQCAEASANMGALLREQGRMDEAASAYGSAGIIRHKQRRFDEAITHYREALRCDPKRAATYSDLGTALHAIGHFDESIASYQEALRLAPDFAAAQANMANVLHFLGRDAEAVESYKTALRFEPNLAVAHLNLGATLLSSGKMEQGWREYEWRWQTEQMRADLHDFAQPLWRGEEAEGKTLLIHAEQGFGDTLQFCRYASLVAARGLRVVLGVPSPLVRLLGCLPAKVVVQSAADLPPFDLHCPMLSLPLAMGTTLATVPGRTPYLRPDAEQSATWKTRLDALPGFGLRVGLVWTGSSYPPATNRRRSIAPERLAPLMAVPGVRFFSLQKDGPAVPPMFPVTDFMSEMHDFADTAALVAHLDLVISVDTAVLHLAGALGKPVWMLDRFDHCWRWIGDRRDSPWYPTLRVYRQPALGDWDPVIAKISRDLREFAASAVRKTG